MICWAFNNGGRSYQNCKFWHKEIPQELKWRLARPKSRPRSRSASQRPPKGNGKGKGKPAAPVEVDQIEGKFNKIADNCKRNGIKLCAAYLNDPNSCRKGNACKLLHYDQSLADRALAAVQGNRELPMDLHKKPRNQVIAKKKKNSQA